MTVDEYKALAAVVHGEGELPSWVANYYLYEGYVQPKERPRSGKGGRMFTPPATRQFEATIKSWGIEQGMKAVTYPVQIELSFYDKTEDKNLLLLGSRGLIYNQKGDLDNREKAVLDGLNGVAYKDDKQIVNLWATRRYSKTDGFRMSIRRAGLNKTEYAQLLKFL